MSSADLTCLIVDDSRVIRLVARRALEGLGFACLEAEDGAGALKLCAEAMPGAILLDRNMPVMNGLEFLRRLRRMEGGRRPKVVLCTTENDVISIAEAISAGADEYVMKPFDAQILADKFAQVGLVDPAAPAGCRA